MRGSNGLGARPADGSATVIHTVPYYAQWASPDLVPAIIGGTMRAADDPLWAEYGAKSPQEYEWWSWRLCGMACLRMALGFWRHPVPAPMALAAECIEAGAYVKRADGLDGLIYGPFASYAERRWGLHARSRPRLPGGEIPELVASGRLLLLSVHPSIRELAPSPPHRGGHLVLAVGTTEDHVVIHNPSGFPGHSQQFARIPWKVLDRYYAGRGVELGLGAG
ncbi:C39 family peptidase [Streptomyces sp. NPDC002187]|uniref:C39 family peptidase n=1 Tax=Streptomyces sp. NPDC002187 TaxID=3364637 RepID=UPI0036983493